MSRRHGLFYSLAKSAQQAHRQQVQAQRLHERALARAHRESAQRQRALAQQAKADARDRQVALILNGAKEADQLNEDLEAQLSDLQHLLTEAIETGCGLDFESLKKAPENQPFSAGKLGQAEPAPQVERYYPAPLSGLQRLLPSAT